MFFQVKFFKIMFKISLLPVSLDIVKNIYVSTNRLLGKTFGDSILLQLLFNNIQFILTKLTNVK